MMGLLEVLPETIWPAPVEPMGIPSTGWFGGPPADVFEHPAPAKTSSRKCRKDTGVWQLQVCQVVE